MTYITYRLLHLLGIFLLVSSLAAMAMHTLARRANGGETSELRMRALLRVTHAVAAALVVFGGFGMLARLGALQMGIPGWALLKLAIWTALAAAAALSYRGPVRARVVLVVAPLLAALAGGAALLKPFQ